MNFEDELMTLEERAVQEGVDLDAIISAYELRKMALEEENAGDEE